jgi:molybdopterin/thiamine biosynthesis adenylyltransferase
MEFQYSEMTRRNIGFVTEAQQASLREASVFVVGTGGMGGACLQALVRAGIAGFEIADMDSFEVSNLNRQVFSSMPSVGAPKAETTRDRMLEINPEARIRVHGADWTRDLDGILSRNRLVINGMDDISAGILLYRRAREHGATVIDAYTSPLPSVTVVGPADPRPEERLRFPTVGITYSEITAPMIDACKAAEIEYVMVHSSSAEAIDLGIAAEMIAGKRSRMSFAPMVITTGNLMAYEAIAHLLGKPSNAGFRGYFLNPAQARVERPRSAPIAMVRRHFVRKFLNEVTRASRA